MANLKTNQKEFLVNEEINLNNSTQVRVIGLDESIVVSFSEAKEIAASKEMDIIAVNLNSNPPIIRIADYNKFIYDLKKSAKKNKTITKPLKEIDLNVNIASNDLLTKVNHAKSFINDGSKVKVVLTIRGRELTRRDVSKKVFYDFISMIDDVAVPETPPKDEGNKAIVILKKK